MIQLFSIVLVLVNGTLVYVCELSPTSLHSKLITAI